jgi:hypothetical protein
LPGLCDVGPALFGIVRGQRLVGDLAPRSGHPDDVPGAFENREFIRIADVDRQRFRRL